MEQRTLEPAARRVTYTVSLLAALLTITMVIYSEVAFRAAVQGLKVWWEVVFPALLPFFIGAQILMGLGVVHFMGVLLEPLMRPVFNVPGSGSFVMAMGLASGYPIGSVLTAKLRRQGLCTKTEAERLMSFTNTADPLFMSGAVAVGMFGRPELAAIIMVAHYLGSLTVGLALRFYGPWEGGAVHRTDRSHLFVRALRALERARAQDGRPLGRLAGDAVMESINTLLLIGGFIIMFSVIIKMLTVAGVLELLSAALSLVLVPLGLDPAVVPALISGLFEITIGTQAASRAPAELSQQLIAASAIIAWSGLSVLGQVASIVQDTDINILPYLCSRVLHAAMAGLYTAGILIFIGPLAPAHLPAADVSAAPTWGGLLLHSTMLFLRVIGVALLVTFAFSGLRTVRITGFRLRR